MNPFYVSGPDDAGASLGIPGFDGDVRYNNPGLPSINISNFSGLGGGGTNWFQFDTTFQMSNVLAYNRGSHNMRTGFDLRRMATGRRAANDPRGRFDFTGPHRRADVRTGYAMADFMLGLPRTVIPPTDQIQGHVGGWRNGFFVNDVWQASRDLTLSLGLRYELNTPVQTYEGVASMLAEDFETIIPSPSLSAYPVPRVQVPRAELQGHRAAARRHLSSGREDGGAGRLRHLLQPEPDELVHVPDQQPAGGRGDDVHVRSRATRPCRFANPTGPVGPAGRPDIISPTRELPNARKDQWSFDLQRELWRGTALDLQYVGSQHQEPGSQLLQQHADAGCRHRRFAPAEPELPQRRIIANDLVADYDAVSIILRKRTSHGLQADAHYTWSRTRDMAHALERRRHDDGQLRHLAGLRSRRTGTSRTGSSPATSTTFRSSGTRRRRCCGLIVGGWQVSGVTTLQSGSPVNITISQDVANIGIRTASARTWSARCRR